MRTTYDDFLIGVLDFWSFVIGVKNMPVAKYIMKTTISGSTGAIPATVGSTIGFESTSGKEDRAAASMATANPTVVDVLILGSLERTEFTLVNCNETLKSFHHFHNWK
jgi:hypothetical protein